MCKEERGMLKSFTAEVQQCCMPCSDPFGICAACFLSFLLLPFPSLPFSSLPHFKFLAKKEKNERIFTEVTVFEIRTFWTHTNSDSECCTSAPWELYGECLLDSFRPNTRPVLFHEPLFQGGDMICYGNFMV